MEPLFLKKMIGQSLSQYHLTLDETEKENMYSLLIERIQRRCAANDGELYEIVEDEVYELITNA